MAKEKVEVVVEKNYPSRRLLAGFFMVPMLLLISALLLVPFFIVAPDLATAMWVALPITIVGELLAIYWVLSYAWESDRWKEALSLYRPKVKHLLLGLGIGVLLFGGLQGVSYGLEAIGFGVESSDTSITLGELAGLERWVILYFFSPILVPIVEELFFRGALLNSFRKSTIPGKWATPVAVVLSSVLFALVHFQGFSEVSDFALIGWIFVVAVINALLVLKFKSIWVAAASHIGYNGVTVLIFVLASFA